MHHAREAADCVAFWRDAGPEAWFRKDEAFDERFRERFLAAHFAVARRECDAWLDSADGALAMLILLDQFPRNAFRGSAHMYATDPLARHVADRAIAAGHDQAIAQELRVFVYMPFEHSEDLADQHRAVELIRPLGAELLGYAELHRDIILRFGRFPHRHRELGRTPTPEELAFLAEGGFKG